MGQSAPEREERKLADSPLFWVCLFATAATVGLAVIGPKYGGRQLGLEQRQAGREEGWRNRVEGDRSSETESPPREVEESEPSRRILSPLVVLFGAIALGSWMWLTVRMRRQRAMRNSLPPG
jgi:hypothetical protein